MTGFDRVLVIDCQLAGISGDMLLGALIDLGANVNKVTAAIKSLEKQEYGYKNIKINLQQIMRRGFKATKIDVTAESSYIKTAQELIKIVEESAKNIRLSEKARQLTSNVIRTLVNTEATLHGNTIADAHLHEIGLVDTPAEIIGTAVAMEDLGLFNAKIYATPVSVGGGILKFSHGTVAGPAPATLAILTSKHFPLKGGPVNSELTTPTGAALLVNLADEVSNFYPEMTPLKVGYGAGNKDFSEIPNVLRVILGAPLETRLLTDDIVILETNIDDATGEVIGYTMERLLREGAKDVCIIPMFTKKNRPGHILKIVADPSVAEKLSRVIIEETGTLGVRGYSCVRHILNREVFSVKVRIDGVEETVKVKVARDRQGKIIRIKPEYEEVKKIAEKGKSLREIIELVTLRVKEMISAEESGHESQQREN
ncbi:MAG: nickel pincer cofactor biosynthesis protein LarC [Candidatus Bathyarchaeota archaeon]|nr:nickel pincer cofactor biosynthesis protein LarC [Candidatus Bathyarchaeota archaeon]